MQGGCNITGAVGGLHDKHTFDFIISRAYNKYLHAASTFCCWGFLCGQQLMMIIGGVRRGESGLVWSVVLYAYAAFFIRLHQLEFIGKNVVA